MMAELTLFLQLAALSLRAVPLFSVTSHIYSPVLPILMTGLCLHYTMFATKHIFTYSTLLTVGNGIDIS